MTRTFWHAGHRAMGDAQLEYRMLRAAHRVTKGNGEWSRALLRCWRRAGPRSIVRKNILTLVKRAADDTNDRAHLETSWRLHGTTGAMKVLKSWCPKPVKAKVPRAVRLGALSEARAEHARKMFLKHSRAARRHAKLAKKWGRKVAYYDLKRQRCGSN